MEKKELWALQALPLEVKIAKSKKRIREWIEFYGDRVYVSFSGGLGSSVLYRLVKEVEMEMGKKPAIPFLFVNTRNEFPEVVHHVYAMKAQNNEKYLRIVKGCSYHESWNVGDTIEVRVSERFQRDIFREHGYLVGSKRVSRTISDLRKLRAKDQDYERNPRYLVKLDPDSRFSVPKKYQYLLEDDIPFQVSHKCCVLLKEQEFSRYEKETGRDCPITGEMAEESDFRTSSYLRFGCNGFGQDVDVNGRKKPKSTPLGFWTQQDLLQYVRCFNLPIPSCYGKIHRDQNGRWKTTGEQRTGCMACLVPACHKRNGHWNYIQKLRSSYPKQYEYMMRDLKDGGLGMEPVIKSLGIDTRIVPEYPLEELLDLFGSQNVV